MIPASKYPALVLNADHSPLAVVPPSIYKWEEAVKAVIARRVAVVAEYDVVVRSPTVAMRLPSVIALREYQDLERPAARNRLNLYVAYHGRCAYCGAKVSTEEMTFEHIFPQARGGKTVYENLALACIPCNLKKGCRTPAEAGMRLIQEPRHPTIGEINRSARKMPLEHLLATPLSNLYWRSYLMED